PNGEVRFAVAVVITRSGNVAANAPSRYDHAAVRALVDIELAFRGTEHCRIGLAIAVVVSLRHEVAGTAERAENAAGPVRALLDVPFAFGTSKDREVGLAVPIIVARHWCVAADAPASDGLLRARSAQHEPLPGRGPPHGQIGRRSRISVG